MLQVAASDVVGAGTRLGWSLSLASTDRLQHLQGGRVAAGATIVLLFGGLGLLALLFTLLVLVAFWSAHFERWKSELTVDGVSNCKAMAMAMGGVMRVDG